MCEDEPQGWSSGVSREGSPRALGRDAPYSRGFMAQRSPAYKQILLKLSGEALLGDQHYGIDPAIIRRVAAEITEVVGLGVQVGLVIGGGIIFRGAGLAEAGVDRVTADQMG